MNYDFFFFEILNIEIRFFEILNFEFRFFEILNFELRLWNFEFQRYMKKRLVFKPVTTELGLILPTTKKDNYNIWKAAAILQKVKVTLRWQRTMSDMRRSSKTSWEKSTKSHYSSEQGEQILLMYRH